jgi:DNA ligase (NAD+)
MTSELRMQKLITLLHDAAKKYYTGTDESPLTDIQYDRYLEELKDLEAAAGYKLASSPTVKVGYEEVDDKIRHYSPILSLKSTKNIDELLYFLGEEDGMLSWKLDGISIVLYYQGGHLERAVSRGDGLYGKDITKNVLMMRSVPQYIGIKNTVIIRGEGCISIDDFETLKRTEEGESYRNPRNLAAGLINGTKTTNALLHHMTFVAHSIIFIEGSGRNLTTRMDQMDYILNLGFEVVPHIKVANYNLKEQIETMTDMVNNFQFPVDGLVLVINDISRGSALGATSRFPRDSMAFKWPDASKLTTVTGVKWSVSQTGLITPVVLFKPVELEGTTVKQANLHNLKGFESLAIGIGDTIEIFKANKIIPEVEENLTRSGTENHPRKCPVCGSATTVLASEKTRKLYCYPCGERWMHNQSFKSPE